MSYGRNEFDYNGLVAKQNASPIVFLDVPVQRICRVCGGPFMGARIAKYCAACKPAAKARTVARNSRKITEKRRKEATARRGQHAPR